MTTAAYTRPTRPTDAVGAVIVWLINAISTVGREVHICADLGTARRLVAHYRPFNNTRIDGYLITAITDGTTTIEPADLRGVPWCPCGDPDGTGCTIPPPAEPEPEPDPQVGDIVRYHGRNRAEHFATFYIRKVEAPDLYAITDLDYPGVTTLHLVARHSITLTGQRIELCDCGHDRNRAAAGTYCACIGCGCTTTHDDTNH